MAERNDVLPDETIIRLFFDRDENAIQAVGKKYGGYIYTIAYNVLGDEEDCRECVNDVYVRLWNSIPPEKPDSFKAYIAGITRNVALNMYKSMSRQKRAPSEYAVHCDELAEFLKSPLTTEGEAEANELKRIINDFLSSLSERKRYIFISRFYCCDKLEDIAQMLQVSRSTVVKDIFNIKKSLKKLLEKKGYEI